MNNDSNTSSTIDRDDDGLVDLAIEVSEAQVFERKAKRDAIERKLMTKATGISMIPVNALVVWNHAAHQPNCLNAEDIEREIDILETSGQLTPAVGRRLADGTTEVIGRSYLVEAVQAHNDRHPNAPIDLKVDIRLLDEEAAFRLVAQEMNETPRISAWDRGRFYSAAIAQFGSEAAVARELGVHKSTISRRLDVVRTVDLLADKLIVPRDVRQREASWFVQIAGRAFDCSDAPDPEMARHLLATAADLEPMQAKPLFAALRAAVKAETPSPEVTSLAHDGHPIGSIRRKAGGPIRIDLTDAGDVELDTLIELLRVALDHVRSAATL